MNCLKFIRFRATHPRSLALANTDILKEDTMNFERIAGPFPMPSAHGRPGAGAGGAAGVPSARINGLSVAVWKPLVRNGPAVLSLA